MESLSKFLSSASSTGFHITLIVFAIILIIGIAVTIAMEKQKKDKYIKRVEEHREFSKEDVFEEFKDKNRYSDAFNKYIRPYIHKNPKEFHKLLSTFGIDLQSFQRKLLRADVKNITPEEIAVLKVIGLFGFLFIILTTVWFIGIYGVIIALFFLILFYVLPTSRLDRLYKKRKDEIEDTLPNYLRLLANATSAGLTIEEAIRKVSAKYPCLLSEEFKKVENEAKYSSDWEQALENMSFKNDIDELYNLTSEIKITKEKGTPITEMLHRHADKIDMESTFTVTEKARKKATTIIFPIFFFLFVPLLAIILLPTFDIIINQI